MNEADLLVNESTHYKYYITHKSNNSLNENKQKTKKNLIPQRHKQLTTTYYSASTLSNR